MSTLIDFSKYPTSYDTKTPEGRKALRYCSLHWKVLALSLSVPFDTKVSHVQLAHLAAERLLKPSELALIAIPDEPAKTPDRKRKANPQVAPRYVDYVSPKDRL